jgi:hypothetical protein
MVRVGRRRKREEGPQAEPAKGVTIISVIHHTSEAAPSLPNGGFFPTHGAAFTRG